MMLRIGFDGWFQCRLATDPDPADEPRGISGYMRALAGESDFDRIIRFQPPFTLRSHIQSPGVFIRRVNVDGVDDDKHPLLGGSVNLLNDPIYKGENGVVAEDGNEPIVPFVFHVESGAFSLTRTHANSPEYTEFPYPALQSTGIVFAPGQISEATGIASVSAHIGERVTNLKNDLSSETDPVKKDTINRRLAFLSTGAATRFFGAYMPYFIGLGGAGTVSDPKGILPWSLDTSKPWTLDLWMGGWDPDATLGFVRGVLVAAKKE